MKIKTLFLLFTLLLSSEELLHEREYWHKLLHFKNAESQIDDARFFLSTNGKKSPKDELKATLDALKNSDHRDINGTQCKYPARTRWLKENLPNQEIEECKYLPQHLKKFDFKTLYLVYTSSFMNSPASMVGHTFLRFDKDEKTPLLSYALNYSAHIESNTSMLSYAYNGIFGGFKGRYMVIPYYEMVKLYSDMEHRDMWEYKLNLTPQEIERVVLHMFEMKNFYSNYLFFNENCSYNLLWFIELARDDLKLVERFNFITAPLDTIKELEQQGLIKTSIFRASKTTKIRNIYSKIEEKKIAKSFLKEPNIGMIKALPLQEQIDIISFYFLKTNKPIRTDILSYRSQLGIHKEESITPTTNPINSNLATKAFISYKNSQPEFGFRVAYHDIYDIDHDFNEGSYISFLDIKATPKRLESLGLISIDSLVKQDELYTPYSWGIKFGFDREIEDSLRANLQIKGGKSFDIFTALLFIEPTLGVRYLNHTEFSLGYSMGLLKSFKDFKLGLLSTQSYFLDRDNFSKQEAFLTYSFKENMALNVSILELEERKNIYLKLFFYF